MEETELRQVVEAVRARLEAADLSTAHICFHSFPKGACGVTSDLLATVLERRFGVVPMWMNSMLGEGIDPVSHAWLEVEGFTIDITADQFGEAPVVVTTWSQWHQALTLDQSVYYPMKDRNWECAGTAWHLVSDLAGARLG